MGLLFFLGEVHNADIGTNGHQFLHNVFITALNMLDTVDLSLTVGSQTGNDQRRAGAQVTGRDLGTAQMVTTLNDAALDREGGVLDFCRLNDITIQPWSPFWHGLREGVYVDNPLFPELNAKLQEVAAKYGITPTGVVIAWMLRHPAHMQPVAGSMNPIRMKEILAGAKVRITREEWYGIYKSAGFKLP